MNSIDNTQYTLIWITINKYYIIYCMSLILLWYWKKIKIKMKHNITHNDKQMKNTTITIDNSNRTKQLYYHKQ